MCMSRAVVSCLIVCWSSVLFVCYNTAADLLSLHMFENNFMLSFCSCIVADSV